MNRSTVVSGMLMVATLALGGCFDGISGSWRLQDQAWEMEMTLETDGTGEYSSSNPEVGDGVLTWEDRGAIDGHHIEFVCETGCEDPSWLWSCSFHNDGAELVCTAPFPFDDEEFVFVQD